MILIACEYCGQRQEDHGVCKYCGAPLKELKGTETIDSFSDFIRNIENNECNSSLIETYKF
jgi:sarcosine oxidase delta subunit